MVRSRARTPFWWTVSVASIWWVLMRGPPVFLLHSFTFIPLSLWLVIIYLQVIGGCQMEAIVFGSGENWPRPAVPDPALYRGLRSQRDPSIKTAWSNRGLLVVLIAYHRVHQSLNASDLANFFQRCNKLQGRLPHGVWPPTPRTLPDNKCTSDLWSMIGANSAKVTTGVVWE